MYIIEYGRKRPAKKKKCIYCKKDFYYYVKPNRKYCSKECQYKGMGNKKPNVTCAYCNKKFYKNTSKQKNSKSGLFFCNKECKCNAQKIGGIKEIMPPHYGTSNSEDYRKQFSIEELFCRRCGYKEFTCGVDIHHIDEDRSNNEKTNLIPLCSCCHRALHSKMWYLSEINNK